MVAAQHERQVSIGKGALDAVRDLTAGLADLGEEANALVPDRGRLGHCRLNVSPVDGRATDLRKPRLQARIADRRRPHVHASPPGAEVEARADDCYRPAR
jgi:hypothetical protein